jgi:membrane-bound lytic murein transglycosylase D
LIAQRFGVGVADLRQWNNLREGGYLQPGQRLEMEVDVTAQAN